MGPDWDIDTRLYLPYMTREEAQQAVADKAVLLVPVATLEQHGPHAPFHTDIDNVWGVCLQTAEDVDADVRCVVAAPVWWSISPFDVRTYPGCINMREDVFKEALGDVLESYIFGGFKRVIIVNGHGGGTEWMLPDLARRLMRRESHLFPGERLPDDVTVVALMWMAVLEVFAQEEFMAARGNPEGSTDWHGGDVETAVQLYLRPGLVDMDKARKADTYEVAEFLPYDLGRSWFRQYVLAYAPPGRVIPGEVHGICGDPTLATAEEGKRVVELAGEVLGRFVRELASRLA